jgi:hypothetical protein
MNNIIETKYRLINPTHKFSDYRMFLRQQNVYIPKGTRIIDIEVIFEQQSFFDIFNFKKLEDLSDFSDDSRYTVYNFIKDWSNYKNKDLVSFTKFINSSVFKIDNFTSNGTIQTEFCQSKCHVGISRIAIDLLFPNLWAIFLVKQGVRWFLRSVCNQKIRLSLMAKDAGQIKSSVFRYQ